jgi:dTDP-4-dehydrorhamnose reductase
VGDRYFDQMELSGHATRLSDYDAFAALGLRTLRLGLLWERHELDPSWRWADERLARLRELRMRPIASLVHHGSGPRHTSLLDPEFPQKLARYARDVAERYPWVDAYTPVNEPHTTARFSGLYGVWYPHHRSRASCVRALLNQVKATVLSMEAVRSVRADALLIQTDDFGNICGTEDLRRTWETLNARQWLATDLLLGRVDREHPLFDYMRAEGISEYEIFWFAEHRCPPDVLGLNYYVTSDRYIDHRVELYPEDRRSAEGPFADVEAVRIHPEEIGVERLLCEAWRRYGIPLAVSEVHLGGPVEEQIRWVADVWNGIQRARGKGADCVAMTVWALLGSFFWNQLVTCNNGHYEPGVFDVRSGRPVATELAEVVAQMARGEPPKHAALERPGWWRHESRVCFPFCEEEQEIAA